MPLGVPVAIAATWLALAALALASAGASPPQRGATAARTINVAVPGCPGDIDSWGKLSPDQQARCQQGAIDQQQQANEQQSVRVSPETVAPPRPSARRPGGREIHEYDLRTGKGRVRTADGRVEEVQADVDLSLREAVEVPEDPAPTRRRNKLPDVEEGLKDVTTDTTSPFSGFGKDYHFVSGDEALSRFAIPPFLVPIYVAAGRAYDVPWNLLASINQIETDFGRIRRQVSSAGALGWMQFMPGTWRAYGVDASGDGLADPFNPVDAIYAAARYLQASGAPDDLRKAVFAYNHADWYVDRVLKTASVYGSLPEGIVAETGSLAFGHFPVRGRVSYEDDFREDEAAGREPEGLWLRSRGEAVAVATQNVEVDRILLSPRLARAFRRDGKLAAYGLTDPGPTPAQEKRVEQLAAGLGAVAGYAATLAGAPSLALVAPHAPTALETVLLGARTPKAGMPRGYGVSKVPGVSVVVEDPRGNAYRYSGLERVRGAIRPGAKLKGSQAIGRLPRERGAKMLFSVRAAGGAPVDPRPLIDGYRLQQAADFYKAVEPLGGSPFVPDEDFTESIGGVVGGSRSELAARVLRDPGISVYPCGEQDIRKGIVDKRVLSVLLILSKSGLEPTVTSLRCGHGYYTKSGGVSAHSYGAAVDIAQFNGQPVMGHQGPGSLTEQAIKILMRLDGEARPNQLISLMNLGGPSFAMGDHADHLHVGFSFQQSLGVGRSGSALGPVSFDGTANIFGSGKASKRHEKKLSDKLGRIENPRVPRRRGAGARKVEFEHRDDDDRHGPDSPVTVTPSSAGARLIDVAVPRGGRRDEAWALGTISGIGKPGFAKRQVVVLRYGAGTWVPVGAPRGAAGQVTNPDLRALAVTPGGRGYAVGAKGQVVALLGRKLPRALRPTTKVDLEDVAVVERRGRVSGFAVGERGTALRLGRGPARRERAARRRSGLSSVFLYRDGRALAVGTARGELDPFVYRRTAAGWRRTRADLGLPKGMAARFTAITADGDELWASGAVSDTRTLGSAAEVPLAARFDGVRWHTFCAGTPALAAVKELGESSSTRGCDDPLSNEPSEHGPAGEVAVTERGVLLATTSGLHVRADQGFRPVAAPGISAGSSAATEKPPRLGLTPDGRGWLIQGAGGTSRVSPLSPGGRTETDSERLPIRGRGTPAAVAVGPGGDRALATTGEGLAALGEGGWKPGAAPKIGVRELGFAGSGRAWAISDTDELLVYDDGRWSAPASSAVEKRVREAVSGALGTQPLLSPERRDPERSVFNALAVDERGEGYAVGGVGVIARLAEGRVVALESGLGAALTDVALSGDRAVAVGRDATLLERADGEWDPRPDAQELAAGADFEAVAAVGDRFVAIAAGAALERSDEGWARTAIPPLGVRTEQLAGYRDSRERTHLLALVRSGDGRALLHGSEAGWRPIALPAGMALDSFAFDPGSKRILLTGRDTGRVVVAARTLDSDTRERDEDREAEQRPSAVERALEEFVDGGGR